MSAFNFKRALTFIRRTDAAIAEVAKPIIEHVLTQWHKHGNKTPAMELQLAINGGVDTHGLFGKKGETLRGVSKGIAAVFAVKLGKADPATDVEAVAAEQVAKNLATKAEAREAAAKRKAERDAEAKPAEEEAEAITYALLINGAAHKITPAEAIALERTLHALRAARTVEAEAVVQSEKGVIELLAA